jgi:putative transposase
LDSKDYGEKYLENPDVARILMDKILSYNNSNYDLITCCIMSNHVHLLIDLYVQIEDIPSSIEVTEKNYKPLYDIMKLIKGGSAFEINKVLQRKGRFWQVEYYDHYVRGKKEFLNIIYYIANNPVKAGIVKNWKDYQFIYVKEECKINLP